MDRKVSIGLFVCLFIHLNAVMSVENIATKAEVQVSTGRHGVFENNVKTL